MGLKKATSAMTQLFFDEGTFPTQALGPYERSYEYGINCHPLPEQMAVIKEV